MWKELGDDDQKVLESESKKQGKKLSVKGLADAPAVFRKVSKAAEGHIPQFKGGTANPERRILGGVIAKGGIERTVTINLVALRGLQAGSPEETKALRSYLLALALMAATAEIDLFLREGCHLRFKNMEDKWHHNYLAG